MATLTTTSNSRTVQIQLAATTEARLREKAQEAGMSLESFLEELSEQEANRNGEADPLTIAIQRMVNRTPEQILADRSEVLKTVRLGRALPTGKTLFDVVEGTWPGDETDAQIREALEKLS